MDNKLGELKAAAMAATPGRIGDRIDGSGSIKYECTGYDGSLVLRTDHKDMEYGFVGDNADADELFFRLCVPDVVVTLLAELEAKDKRIAELSRLLAHNIERAEKAEKRLVYSKDAISTWERKAISNFDECATMSQRIIELETIRSDASQVFKEIGNELGCNPDNESIMMAIDDLKKRLATPVRLTDERTLWAGEDDYDTGHVKGWNANRLEQAALLKKQGFTVAGDE
ncbi:ead/Ea22-like family protein [Serratia marcescens]|nr:ead/Ea22-like family protein [Serratia marcescens]